MTDPWRGSKAGELRVFNRVGFLYEGDGAGHCTNQPPSPLRASRLPRANGRQSIGINAHLLFHLDASTRASGRATCRDRPCWRTRCPTSVWHPKLCGLALVETLTIEHAMVIPKRTLRKRTRVARASKARESMARLPRAQVRVSRTTNRNRPSQVDRPRPHRCGAWETPGNKSALTFACFCQMDTFHCAEQRRRPCVVFKTLCVAASAADRAPPWIRSVPPRTAHLPT